MKMEHTGKPFEIMLLDIPWHDVLFKYVFQRLGWKDLFHLRQVSTEMKFAISEYFECNKCVDLTEINNVFNANAFTIATNEASVIRFLLLSNCKWVTSDCLKSVLEKNKNILQFAISGCSAVSNACLQVLAKSENLKKLSLQNCHWLISTTVILLAVHCSKLEYVDLTNCWEVSDEAICELVYHCPGLKYLSISRIYGITDKSLSMIAWKGDNLEELNLAGCWRVTNHGIRLIGMLCGNLKFLRVDDCKDVTEDSLSCLRDRMQIDHKTRFKYNSILWNNERHIL